MGRPSKPLISRQRTVEAALALIDENGPDGMTVRQLGAKLNVHAASLYHHFRDKDEILEAVVGHLLGRIQLPDPELPTDRWFLELARALRATLQEHPKVAWLAGRFSVEARAKSTPIAKQRLAEEGLTGLEAVRLINHLFQYSVGSAIVRNAFSETGEDDPQGDALFDVGFLSLFSGLRDTMLADRKDRTPQALSPTPRTRAPDAPAPRERRNAQAS